MSFTFTTTHHYPLPETTRNSPTQHYNSLPPTNYHPNDSKPAKAACNDLMGGFFGVSFITANYHCTLLKSSSTTKDSTSTHHYLRLVVRDRRRIAQNKAKP
jgi:hypothetical protein